MERKTIETNQEKMKKLTAYASNMGSLYRAFWEYSRYRYGGQTWADLWKELSRMYGKEPTQLRTEEEFWTPKMEKMLADFVDAPFVRDMKEIVHMRMEGQFSASPWRRSYRSKDFGYHAAWVISEIAGCVQLTVRKQSIEEMLYCAHDWERGFEIRLALELRRKNEQFVNPIKEAILGENTELLLSRRIIEAIVISGNEELVELLLKLLVAARLQEGLRQSILESADEGSIETLMRILKVCLDEDLFRFSSAIRAFDTWTGLGYGDAKPAGVKKYASLAYEYLTNPTLREESVKSENNLETYLALWAIGCHEIEDTDRKAKALLKDEAKYRRILGWYFVTHTDSSSYKMSKAMEHLDERDEEILAWIVTNLSVTNAVLRSWNYQNRESKVEPSPNFDFPSDKRKREDLFRKLKEIALFIGNKEKTFTGNPFPYSYISMSSAQVINCLMSVAGYDMDLTMIDELVELFPIMSVDQRRAVYVNFLAPDRIEKHRLYFLEALKDRSVAVKELAVNRLSKCKLEERDILALCESLRTKSSDMRKSVISVLTQQKKELQEMAVSNLLEAEEESRIQAGIEMLLQLRDEAPEIMDAEQERVEALREKSLSTQTEILLKRLIASEDDAEAAYSVENGFGLYNPAVVEACVKRMEQGLAAEPEPAQPENTAEAQPKGLLSRLFKSAPKKQETPERGTAPAGLWTEAELRALIPSGTEVMRVLENMNQVFVRNANYEYEIEMYDGSHQKMLFGDGTDTYRRSILIPAEYGCRNRLSGGVKLTMIPFWEEFVEAAGEYAKDIKKTLGLMYVTGGYNAGFYGTGSSIETQKWYRLIESKNLSATYHGTGQERFKNRYWQMTDIIPLFIQQADPHEVFEMAFTIYRSMIAVIGEQNLGKNTIQQTEESKNRIYYGSRVEAFPINLRPIGYWRQVINNLPLNEEDYRRWFLAEYRIEHLAGVSIVNRLSMDAYFRACEDKLIPIDALYQWLLLGQEQYPIHIRSLTNPVKYKQGKEIYERYPWAKDAVDRMVGRIVEVESKRGELPTVLTGQARQIERFEGAEYFCNLLAALGKENFFRGYAYSNDNTKRAVLSQLLKRCYPSKEDTPEKLAALLKKTDIKEKRLAEAVMYAPQWAGFAEEIMKWPGLKKAVWFFHAHVSEHFSAEKETEVAIYSPVTPQQFNDGAFDKNWFLEAYETLGEKHFEVLYKSAKYITNGNSQHRRSQLYADAVLGKMDAAELKAEITDKRNQEKLRAFAVIPIPKDKPEELLRRYEFIQQFLKESRQFGSQRRESEKKACQTALENLAITSGFQDVNRMTWYLESEKMEEIRPLMEPVEAGGVTIYLDITEDGTAELAIRKGEKVQKTLPASLKKDETVLRIKETVKELKDQKSRARKSLETAMVERTAFGVQELQNIAGNPVISPMLFALVWTDGTQNGFLEANDAGKLVLKNLGGQSLTLNAEENLWIAHPYDLKQAGEWAAYMHLLYEKKLVQPFKQVFREFYPITEDELQEKTISRRYAGYQVQPQRTVALLKGRGWTVDYEEGLQRVCYQENLIVRMYALADWFSPADIEAPTLETIQFYDRTTGQSVDLEKVPPILFSEVMRDIDLVVSVAHVGGVDPETSHSTVEMRTAIAGELVQLLKLKQVEFIGSHAKIQGKLASYSVHMGSGVVHAEGKGMLAILPVHSQARGRIFLPFADDDPKTAEIMSKIILLAEDNKIKDPTILQQLS